MTAPNDPTDPLSDDKIDAYLASDAKLDASVARELLLEVRARRKAFTVDEERTDLDDLLDRRQRADVLSYLRDTMLAKFGPLAVGSATVGDWKRVVDETAREAAHRFLLIEVSRPPCHHDELLYTAALMRRDRELRRVRAALEYCHRRFAESGTMREIGNDDILECAKEIADGKVHADGSCHYPGVGGCSPYSTADDCPKSNK